MLAEAALEIDIRFKISEVKPVELPLEAEGGGPRLFLLEELEEVLLIPSRS